MQALRIEESFQKNFSIRIVTHPADLVAELFYFSSRGSPSAKQAVPNANHWSLFNGLFGGDELSDLIPLYEYNFAIVDLTQKNATVEAPKD